MSRISWSGRQMGVGVHTVFVDGQKVVDSYRMITIDETALYSKLQSVSEEIDAHSGLKSGAI